MGNGDIMTIQVKNSHIMEKTSFFTSQIGKDLCQGYQGKKGMIMETTFGFLQKQNISCEHCHLTLY